MTFPHDDINNKNPKSDKSLPLPSSLQGRLSDTYGKKRVLLVIMIIIFGGEIRLILYL